MSKRAAETIVNACVLYFQARLLFPPFPPKSSSQKNGGILGGILGGMGGILGGFWDDVFDSCYPKL